MTRKIAYTAVLTALAMIFSYVEALFPLPVGVPGIKVGLANLVVLLGLYFLEPKQVLTVSVLRIVLTAFLFGNMASMAYGLAGGILSFAVMVLLKRCKGFSMTGVSIAGAVSHNLGQIAVAAAAVGTVRVFYYLPVLVFAGIAAGAVVGGAGRLCLPAVRKLVSKP